VLRQSHRDAEQLMHCLFTGCTIRIACAPRARALRARTCELTNGSTGDVHVPFRPCSQSAVVMSRSPAGLSPLQAAHQPQTYTMRQHLACKASTQRHPTPACKAKHARKLQSCLHPEPYSDYNNGLTSAACNHAGTCIQVNSINALLRDHTH
jgi:hypothetical protein